MSRLPPALQPAWPLVKRAHRLLSLVLGLLTRPVSRLFGERALPQRGTLTSAETVAREPDKVRLHPGGHAEELDREAPVGEPASHWTFELPATYRVPATYCVEIDGGTVVGDWGANLTADGTLDYATSEYFGINRWREHPIFLRPRLPRVSYQPGTVVSLATRGGSVNYYHFLMDVLPRWRIFQETLPDRPPDAIYVPTATRYQRELISLMGLDRTQILPAGADVSVRADQLVVPSLPNPREVAPSWIVSWLRSALPAREDRGLPTRLYITRGQARNTRRYVDEPDAWPAMEDRGFTRIDPGSMGVQDQIDHFAAAEVIVAPHGAALTNLVFAQPGVRVLELFAPTYVKSCFWAIVASIPGARYRYLVCR